MLLVLLTPQSELPRGLDSIVTRTYEREKTYEEQVHGKALLDTVAIRK